MRAVNLMPRDERGARLETGRLPLLVAAGGVAVVTAVAFLVASSASGSAGETRAEVQAVEAAIALVPKGPGGAALNGGTLAQERSNRVAALSAALTSRTAFDQVLRDIALVLPGDVWLTKLEASAPVAAVPLAGAVPTPQTAVATGVTIEGATFSHDSVATVLGRLAVVPTLTGVRLTSTALVEPLVAEESDSSETPGSRGRPFVTFVISAAVRTGDES
jgi:hypothetical protein